MSEQEELKAAVTVISDYCVSRRKDCLDCLFYDREREDLVKCKLRVIPMDWWLEIGEVGI